jgi:hypothetical protein
MITLAKEIVNLVMKNKLYILLFLAFLFSENGCASTEKTRCPHPPSELPSAAPKELCPKKEKLRIKEYRVYFS